MIKIIMSRSSSRLAGDVGWLGHRKEAGRKSVAAPY